jgi:PAT family beta-lactamase induction signal transducer AmpG
MIFPFIAKIFLGLASDRLPIPGLGRRKPYMLLGLAIAGSCFLAVAGVDPGLDFQRYATLMITAAFGMALFDTCADGYAIDVSQSSEAGIVQSFMMAGKALGYIACSSFFGWVAQTSGFAPVFQMLALVVVLVAIGVAFAKQEDTPTKAQKNSASGAFDFLRSLGKPMFIFAIYGIIYSIASFGIDGIVTLFLHRRLGLEEGVVGIYGSLRGLGAVAGAALAGYTAIHYSRTKTVIFSLSFLTLSAFLIMAIQGAWSAYLIGFIWGMAWSYQETIFVMLAMLLSERAMAATVFALLMMSSNIGIAIGEAMATPMALSVGFEPTFIALAIIGLCALVPVMLLMKLMPTK